MTSLLWLPIILSSVCLFLIYLFKKAVGTRNSIDKRSEVSKHLKSAILYLMVFVWVYILIYSVPDAFHLVVESSKKGDVITSHLVNITLIIYIILSTYLMFGFIRNAIKTIVGIMRNRKLNAEKER